MAQLMNYDSIATSCSMDKKTYSVNFKGLMTHLRDIMFSQHPRPSHLHYIDELSGHLQKDIGLYK